MTYVSFETDKYISECIDTFKEKVKDDEAVNKLDNHLE